MPKKTRKEKVIADLRRKLMSVSVTSPVPELKAKTPQSVQSQKQTDPMIPLSITQTASGFSLENLHSLKKSTNGKKVEKLTQFDSKTLRSKYRHVIFEMRKIAFLTVLAITFEAVVYWFIAHYQI